MTIDVRDLAYLPPHSKSGLGIPALSIETGERLALIGPSGCGKTTFLNLISALLSPRSGTIHVSGQAVHTMSDKEARTFRAREIGYIFQDFGLLDYLTARDNILHPFRIARGRRISADLLDKLEENARELMIENRLDHRPHELSQGEKQRVAICRAVMTEPQILLADEPTGNLDPDNATRIMDHIMAVRGLLDATLITVTHDHSLLDRFDRTLDMREFWRAL